VTGKADLSDSSTVLAIVLDAIKFANEAFIAAGISAHLDPLALAPKASAVAQVLVDDTLDMQMLASQANNNIELAALVTKVKLSDETGRTDDLYRFGQGQLTEQQLLAVDARFDDAELNRIRSLTLPPVIAGIGDFDLAEDGSVSGVHFVAFDLDSPPSSLKISIASDNPALIPAGNVSVIPQSTFGDWVLSFAPLANVTEMRISR